MTILSFAAVFAGLGLAAGTGSFGGAAALVAGVFLRLGGVVAGVEHGGVAAAGRGWARAACAG